MRPQFVLSAIVLGLAAQSVRAEVVRYRYVPVDTNGTLAPAAGAAGTAGERSSWYAGPPQPVNGQPRPNFVATFQHPYTGRPVTVPLALPETSTPRLEHRRGDVIYNYGSYTVTVRFHPDGSVETVYNSGFLRPLRVY